MEWRILVLYRKFFITVKIIVRRKNEARNQVERP